jgi:hypothetical protein
VPGEETEKVICMVEVREARPNLGPTTRACLAKSPSWIAAWLKLYSQTRAIFTDARERPSGSPHLQLTPGLQAQRAKLHPEVASRQTLTPFAPNP